MVILHNTTFEKYFAKIPLAHRVNMCYIFSFMNATGPVQFKLTNDYLFRAVLQESNVALTGLICSLLHLSPAEVKSVVITNPIKLGESIDAKDFYLDINVLLNDHTKINLEMQVINHGDWPERSLSYLCRSFDSLNSGQDYIEAKPAIHISFLDFTLFPDRPEFYATYKLLNVKNHGIYSDKFVLSVVDLTQIELATEEDRNNQLDYWASLFKATTWEEIKMIASNNPYFTEAAETMYELSADEEIRLRCQARADYERHENYVKHKLATLEAGIAERDAALAENAAALAEKDTTIAEQAKLIQQLQSQLAANADKA